MADDSPIREFLSYRGDFLAYLMAILRDFEAVFQNAAVVILEGATAGEPIRNFRAWAKEIVRRQALYRLRKQIQDEKRFRPLSFELFEASLPRASSSRAVTMVIRRAAASASSR